MSEVSWHTGVWNITKKRILEDRGALLTEEGDLVKEHKAMHEDTCLSRWLRDDTEGRAREGFANVPAVIPILV